MMVNTLYYFLPRGSGPDSGYHIRDSSYHLCYSSCDSSYPRHSSDPATFDGLGDLIIWMYIGLYKP